MSLRGQSRGARTRLSAETSRFLVVTAGNAPLALHADSVQGLLTIEEAGVTDLPALHGATYPAIDLTVRFGLPSDQDSPDTRVVLLSTGDARGHLRAAQVSRLEEVDRSRVLPLPPQFRGEEREWYRGILLLDEGIALILNLPWLLQGERFTRIQEPASHRGASPRALDTRAGFATGRI